MADAPTIILCCGIFRSASTWAFNVAAAIARTRGAVAIAFADNPDTVAAAVRNDVALVVKGHVPTQGMTLLASLGDIPTIVTIRDPLDCVASMMDSFGETFEVAVRDVVASTRAVAALMETTRPLVIRYEDEAAQGPGTVHRIAEHLGVRGLAKAEAERISERHTPERIQALIASLVFNDGPPRLQHDPEMYWHPRHVGSGRIGRYTDVLNPDQVARVATLTADFRQRNGYGDPPRPPLSSGRSLDFKGEGLPYCGAGFSFPETWGVWTDGPEAHLMLPLDGKAGQANLQLTGQLAPIFVSVGAARMSVLLNGRAVAQIDSSLDHETALLLALMFDAEEADRIMVTFRFENLVEVDPRKLGFGLVHLKLDFKGVEPVPIAGFP